jgi:hypothetical protein
MLRALKGLIDASLSQLDLFGSTRLAPPAGLVNCPRPRGGVERVSAGGADVAGRPLPVPPLTTTTRTELGGRLLARLEALGLRGIERCRVTRNRSVMVSFGAGVLRVHEGFAAAHDDVLRSIVLFVNGRGATRRAARRALIALEMPRGPEDRGRRREQLHPDDRPLARRLVDAHARFNRERFDGALSTVPIHVSRRMRTMLGHYSAGTKEGEPGRIAISRRHIRRHGWREALDTLLHEMVHQWQDETSRPIDHSGEFRRKARAVGISASARRAPPAQPPRLTA